MWLIPSEGLLLGSTTQSAEDLQKEIGELENKVCELNEELKEENEKLDRKRRRLETLNDDIEFRDMILSMYGASQSISPSR